MRVGGTLGFTCDDAPGPTPEIVCVNKGELNHDNYHWNETIAPRQNVEVLFSMTFETCKQSVNNVPGHPAPRIDKIGICYSNHI